MSSPKGKRWTRFCGSDVLLRGRIRRIAFWFILTGFVWACIWGAAIWRYGAADHAAEADCIIVLGAAVRGSAPSPVFAERIRHGIDLYHAGYAPKLLFTGGYGERQEHSEGRVGRLVATQKGVPANDVLFEEASRTTQQNLSEAASVMRKHGLNSAIIVSDPLHMKRAMMMADDLGIDAYSSPTPSTRYRSVRTKLTFLVRELYFVHHYLIIGN